MTADRATVVPITTVTGVAGLINRLEVNKDQPVLMAAELVQFIRSADFDKFVIFLRLIDPQVLKPYVAFELVGNAYKTRTFEIVHATNHIFEIHVAINK